MVRVEPPDTMRPWVASRQAARPSASGSTPACWRNRLSSYANSSAKKRGSTSPTPTGRRQRPSTVGYGRSSFPSRSTTSVEYARSLPVGTGPSETIQPTAAAKMATTATNTIASTERQWSAEVGRLPHGKKNGVRGNHATPQPPHPAAARPTEIATPPCASASPRRLDLHRAGGGAAEAVGPVHVLHIGLRQHVAAGRHRAHHVGDRKHRRIAGLAVERSAEPVVAEFGVRRLHGVLDPRKGAGVAGGDEARIVDLEAGRQVVGQDQAGELRLRLGDLQHHDEALVLLHLGDLGLLAVER